MAVVSFAFAANAQQEKKQKTKETPKKEAAQANSPAGLQADPATIQVVPAAAEPATEPVVKDAKPDQDNKATKMERPAVEKPKE